MVFMKKLARTFAPALTILLIPAAPLLAQDDLCGAPDTDPELFVGVYTMDVGPGYVTDGETTMKAVGPNLVVGGGMTIPSPFPVYDQDEVRIFTMDEELSLADPAGEIAAQVAGPDEPHWTWPSELGAPPISDEELAVVTGCPNEQLPRLIARSTGTSADGQPLEYGYRLMKAGPGLLVGVLEWKSAGFRSNRWVVLEAQR